MRRTPPILYLFTTALIYATVDALFFLMFAIAYTPFGMDDALSLKNGRYEFNIVMLSCIIYGAVLLSHSGLVLLKDKIDRSWWSYIGWWTMEMFVASAYMALYMALMSGSELGYFYYFGLSLKYTFSITVYAHTLLNLVFVIIAFVQQPLNQIPSSLLKFHDSNHKLRFSVDRNSLVYLKSEENYVRICYLEGNIVKEYLLRRSISSLDDMLAKAGFVKCHRSYVINPSYVKALRHESGGTITAELTYVNTPVPVSKARYQELSDRI